MDEQATTTQGGTTRLITGPEDTPATVRAGRGNAPEQTRFLGITTDGDPDALLGTWRRTAGDDARQSGIITVTDLTRSTAARSSDGPISLTPAVSLRTVSGADDLRDLCRAIRQYLEEWSNSPEQTVIAIDSLPALVESTDPAEVFRFLHVLTRMATEHDAVAYVDVSGLETAALKTMEQLLDEPRP